MHIDDFREAQRSGAAVYIGSLFRACRIRFLKAAILLEITGPVIDKLKIYGIEERVYLSPLVSMFNSLCERYVEKFFSAQEDLFEPIDFQLTKWGIYFHSVFVPHIVQDDEFVRNVLRAMNVIPCTDPQLASDALVHHVSEMTLPQARPPWAPEDLPGHWWI